MKCLNKLQLCLLKWPGILFRAFFLPLAQTLAIAPGLKIGKSCSFFSIVYNCLNFELEKLP